MRTNWILAAALVVVLGGCAAQIDKPPPGPVNYQVGYSHGCDSGHATCGNITYRFTKNVDLYLNNREYKVGWDDGYAYCGSPARYPLTGCR